MAEAQTIEDAALRDYYARRAASYERIYHRPERQADLRRLEGLLPGLFAGRQVLEIACGTGWWTPFGAARCTSWLATDASEETLAIARTKKLPAGRVRFMRADAYALDGLDASAFDAAFAGFWWSHVPRQRLPTWIESLHRLLPRGARIAFIDNRYVEGSSTPLSHRDAQGNSWQQRTLDDGSTHEVLKNFPARDEALRAIGGRARDAQWLALDHYWLLHYTLA